MLSPLVSKKEVSQEVGEKLTRIGVSCFEGKILKKGNVRIEDCYNLSLNKTKDNSCIE